LIDGDALIEKQLQLKTVTGVVFPDGRKTTLTPVRYVPVPDNAMLFLDGAWQVKRWPFKKPEKFLAGPEVDDSFWETVSQPGKVFYADSQAHSKPIPNWNRVTQTHLDDRDGAIIRRHFYCPAEWEGKRIYLRFDSIYPAGQLYLNGEYLGAHYSGLTPVEFDVTGKVLPDRKNLVAVRLLRKHRFHKMDMVRHAVEFCGLAQSAYLFATEQVQLSDYHLQSRLSPDLSCGQISGQVKITSFQGLAKGKLSLFLYDPSGEKIAQDSISFQIKPGEEISLPVSLSLEKPFLWNDEQPNLYTVCLILAVKGYPEQLFHYRTGFRRLDLSPEGPRLNGRFIKFRGVNHLTYHPEGGMYTPKEWLRRNLLLMKKANVNAIRTHFLGPRCLAELCDEIGIYLLQELPIDWGTDYIHDPEWVGPALMRIQGGILRDRHHPSVMVWSVGNENLPLNAEVAEDGWNHLRIFHRFCKKLDPDRPTMFPPPGPANKIKAIFEVRVGDIADTHYSFSLVKEMHRTGRIKNPRSWDGDLEEITREEAIKKGWSGVWFSSEYGIFNMMPDLLNAPYLSVIDDYPEDPLSGKNSLQVFIERLEREWGFMREDPTCLGAAYFPWICSGSGKNPWGWVRWAEDADWGVMTADLLPKPYFWALRVAFSPVKFPARVYWQKGQDYIEFPVTNHYNSYNLNQCIFRTQLTAGSRWMGMSREFRDIRVDCQPGEKVTVRIPLWEVSALKSLEENGVALCRINLLDPTGFRPITADIIILSREKVKTQEGEMPIGPDAKL